MIAPLIPDAIPPWEYDDIIDNYQWSYFELYYWMKKEPGEICKKCPDLKDCPEYMEEWPVMKTPFGDLELIPPCELQ